jgi:hypothetical protein
MMAAAAGASRIEDLLMCRDGIVDFSLVGLDTERE